MTEPQPYLPERDASAPPAPEHRGKWKKTLVLWVILIVIFLTIWQFLTPSAGTPRPRPVSPPACDDTSGALGPLYTMVPAFLVIVLFIVILRRSVLGDVAFNSSQEAGLLALAEHRYADALTAFEKVAVRWKNHVAYRAAARLNVAQTHLRAGRIDDALTACIAVERERGVLFTAGIRILGTIELAYLYALAGDLDAAETWIAEARTRLAKTKDERLHLAARLCVAEAVVACRRGKPREAVELFERHWTKLRAALTADAMRSVEVIRAFAEAESGGIREHNVVTQRLVHIEPAMKGEFGYLAVRWPEMGLFLSTHGL